MNERRLPVLYRRLLDSRGLDDEALSIARSKSISRYRNQKPELLAAAKLTERAIVDKKRITSFWRRGLPEMPIDFWQKTISHRPGVSDRSA